MAGPALREVLARFGVEVDASKLAAFDAKVKTSITGLQKIGTAAKATGAFLAAGVFAYGLRAAGQALAHVLDRASDTQESMNVLTETFKENSDQVLAWADQTSEKMGRASSTLRQYAGELGALLVPMLGSRQAAADMSTTLAGLAIDLGSFFNRADNDVLVALRAGIVGETEPLRRLGVELTEASLNAFAMERGLKKITAASTPAEKAQLRFAKIMADTVDKQGDAVRTADHYANSKKALSEAFKTLSEQVGSVFLPAAAKIVNVMAKLATGVASFVEMARQSRIFEAVLGVLGVRFGVLGWRLATLRGLFLRLIPVVRSLAVALAPYALAAAKFILITLAVDELITAFEGGKTVVGDFIDSLFGIGTTQETLDGVRAIVDDITGGFRLAIAAVQDLWGAISGGDTSHLDKAMNAFKGSNVLSAITAASGTGQSTFAGMSVEGRSLSESGRRRRGNASDEALKAGDVAEFVNQRRKGESREEAFERFKEGRRSLVQTGQVEATDRDRSLFSEREQRKMQKNGAVFSAPAGASVSAPVTVQINVPPGTDKALLKQIEQTVKGALATQSRTIKVALGNGAG